MEVVKGRGYVYSIQYHIVWCVKYRRDVLNGQVAIKLKELLTQISKDNDFQILEMNMEEDHIHIQHSSLNHPLTISYSRMFFKIRTDLIDIPRCNHP